MTSLFLVNWEIFDNFVSEILLPSNLLNAKVETKELSIVYPESENEIALINRTNNWTGLLARLSTFTFKR